MLYPKVPQGPLGQKWKLFQEQVKSLSHTGRSRYRIIVTGESLAAMASALGLVEQGYHVTLFCRTDTPARFAVPCGPCRCPQDILDYPEGDISVDDIYQELDREGDRRARQADVYRLAQTIPDVLSYLRGLNVPLKGRRNGLSHAGMRSATQRQLYRRVQRAVYDRRLEIRSFIECLDVCLIDGAVVGIIARDRMTGEICSIPTEAVVLADNGYAGMYDFSLRQRSQGVSFLMNVFRQGAYLANPGFIQFYPFGVTERGRRDPFDICCDADLLLKSERPRDDQQNSAKAFLSYVNANGLSIEEEDVNASPIKLRLMDVAKHVDRDAWPLLLECSAERFHDRYGQILAESQLVAYPSAQYTLGGLWVSYALMTSIRGLFAVGESNYSALGAGAPEIYRFFQGLAEGAVILPKTIEEYFGRSEPLQRDSTQYPEFKKAESGQEHKVSRILSCSGNQPASHFRKSMGELLRLGCGSIRGKSGLEVAVAKLFGIRERFWNSIAVSGTRDKYNPVLEEAMELSDQLDLVDVMLKDALTRQEICGFHSRQDLKDEGLSGRDDQQYSYVSAWEYRGLEKDPFLHKDALVHE